MRARVPVLVAPLVVLALSGCAAVVWTDDDPHRPLRNEILEGECPRPASVWPTTWDGGPGRSAVLAGRGGPAGSPSDDPTSWQGPDKTIFAAPPAEPSGEGLFGSRGSGGEPARQAAEAKPLFGHPLPTIPDPDPPQRGDATRAANALEAIQRDRGTAIQLADPPKTTDPGP